ncbi:hypothetical protein QQM79_20780 [Marinobacteraceae bacterium S3BR75-40.1]
MTGSVTRYIRAFAVLSVALASGVTYGELQRLGDGQLSGISGQSGLTLDLDVNASAGGLSYFDDGNSITLEGVKVGAADPSQGNAFESYQLDIEDNGDLLINFQFDNLRMEFSDLRLSDNATDSGGGVFFDQGHATGYWRLSSGGAVSSEGYTYDTEYHLTGGRLGYRTNGNEVFLDDVTLNLTSLGSTLDVVNGALDIRMPNLVGDFNVGAIRYSNNPLNHGSTYDQTSGAELPSYGGLRGDFDLSTYILFNGGGRFGTEGMMMDINTTINSANLAYVDGGNSLALNDITGFVNVDDLAIDVAPDWNNRLGLALTYKSLDLEFNIASVEMGSDALTSAERSIGSLNVDALFQDHTFDGVNYTNGVYIEAGGHSDAGPQGLRLATQWSLANGNLKYTDDGNTVIFSGIQSWGQGDVTLNVTEAGFRNGTEFFDGLRIGYEGLKVGYRFDGLRVGDENASLQGGTELLLALNVYPTFEFQLDGHTTIGAGGADGAGLTINSDMVISDGTAGIIVNPYSEATNGRPSGLWLSDLAYDIHIRDATVDVTSTGLAVVQGEAWSTMDIGNLRVGDKDTGASFGRVVLQRYEKGSEMRIEPGGADFRGAQGTTIHLKQVFAKAVSETKKNSLTWETNRDVDASGNPINDTGMKLVINDFHTSDGDGSGNNTYGIQTDLDVDVAQTTVEGNPRLGFAVDARSRFKELSINNVDLVHPDGGAATAIYGVKLQNFDVRANLTATPID